MSGCYGNSPEDSAREAELHNHLDSTESYSKDEYVEMQVDFLLSEGQDCYPWSLKNMQEAIAEMSDEDSLSFFAYINAFRNAGVISEEAIAANAMEKTVSIIQGYWERCAIKQADISRYHG